MECARQDTVGPVGGGSAVGSQSPAVGHHATSSTGRGGTLQTVQQVPRVLQQVYQDQVFI